MTAPPDTTPAEFTKDMNEGEGAGPNGPGGATDGPAGLRCAAMTDVTANTIEDALAGIGAAYSREGARLWRVDVPAVDRRSVTVGIAADERTLNLTAFVLRRPDRNAEQVYRRMLHKNVDLTATGPWRFALDEHDDVYLVAQIGLAQATESVLDHLLGALSALVDATWLGLMRLGFEVPSPPVNPAGADGTSDRG